MDRSKWEYKKLGEVATFERGLTYSKGDEATISSNGVLRSNNIDLDTHELVFDEIKYLSPNFVIPESKKLKKDSIFICMSNGSKAHLGKVAFADKDYDYAFGGFMGMIVPQNIFPKYLFYYFLSHNYRNGLEQIGKGANINNLRFAQLAEFKVPTPPMEDQQRIVAELDCLNEMIAVKQEQLKEFDKLAQSIFYDMFGDPVSNEKGWEEEKMGTVCSFSQGIQIDLGEQSANPKDGFQRFIRISDYTTNDCELRYVKDVDQKYHVDIDDIAIVRYGASAGFVCVGLKGILANNLFKLNHDKTKLCTAFLKQQLSTDYYKSFIKAEAFGVAMPALSFKSLKHFKLIIPPLSLQQQFADKISAIEAQKELVKQSIAEAQALLDYTMDYYFNE